MKNFEILEKINEFVIVYKGSNSQVSKYVECYCFDDELEMFSVFDLGFYIELEEYEDEETGEIYTDDFDEMLDYEVIYSIINSLELDCDYYEFYEACDKLGIKIVRKNW